MNCVGENTSADYAQVTSVVTWPGMANSERSVLRSIVSPTNNTIDSSHGTLTVTVSDEGGDPKAGVDLKASVYSAETNAEGCATFPDLPQGSVTLESNGEDADLVSPNSAYVEKTNAGVGAGATKSTKLIYDSPGTVPVKFKYRVGSTATFKAAYADSVVAFHSVMKEAKVLGTPEGPRLEQIEAFPLFPFTSSYSIHAGSCSKNNPGTGAGTGTVVVPAGGATGPLTIQLPALDLTVKKGGAVVKGATVTVTDRNCEDSSKNLIKRVYTTNEEGKPSATSAGEAELGQPWGVYDLCASATVSGASYRRKSSEVAVQNLAAAKSVTLELTETDKSPCS